MLDDDDHHRRRITPYEDLFGAISENKRIEVGLHSVIAMDDKCDTAIREMAQAVLEEIEFFRQRKRGLGFSAWSNRGRVIERNPQHAVQIDKTEPRVCDPIVLEMTQAVMEEIQFVRKSREMQHRCGCIFIPFLIIFFLLVLGVMIFHITQFVRNT